MGTRRRAALAAVLALLAGALLGSTPAVADPPTPGDAPPPPPTGYAPPPSGIGNVLGQSDAPPAGPLGLPDLSAYAPALILGQYGVPSAPGADTPVAAPDLRVFDSAYLLPQNVAPAAPGQGVPGPGLGPTPQNPSTGRLAFLRRLHEMYQGGGLAGAFLGQVSDEQLGEPLPGTAPPPGVYPPSGLGQNLPNPAAPQQPQG